MAPVTVLYHAGCTDGFTAAWILHKVYPDGDFIAVSHGHPPPDVTGRSVIIADFSYPRQTMIDLDRQAESLVTYDHHRTAEIELAGLPNCVFDMERSGAKLVWDYNSEEILSRSATLINYVEDRDLWKNALPFSKEISAVVQSTPFTFADYDDLSDSLNWHFHNVVQQGKVLLRSHGCMEQRIVKSTMTMVTILDYLVPAVNSPVLQSELGHMLDDGSAFAVAWYIDGDGLAKFSLRSREPDGIDVSEIAKHFGGGGHFHSSGFSVPYRLALNMFDRGGLY